MHCIDAARRACGSDRAQLRPNGPRLVSLTLSRLSDRLSTSLVTIPCAYMRGLLISRPVSHFTPTCSLFLFYSLLAKVVPYFFRSLYISLLNTILFPLCTSAIPVTPISPRRVVRKMIQSNMAWQPKLRPKGIPHSIDDFTAVTSLSELEYRTRTGEDKRDQRVFRVKRKHVLKACDRCRVKKTKCDGKQPCNRCSVYNHPCLFRERKATQTKVYSRGFVEMLESHHSLVVKALQKLYKFCINNEGFPGEPLAEAPDGHPLTHAILDRLGLIKQAEENADEPDEDSEDLRYLRILSTSTECSVTAEPSPEPTTPPESSQTTLSHSTCPVPTPMPARSDTAEDWQWDLQPVQQPGYSYPDAGYHDLMALQRSSMTAPDMCTDISPPIELSAGPLSLPHHQQHDPPFSYVLDGCCDSATAQPDTKPILTRHHSLTNMHTHPHPHSHTHPLAGNLSGDMSRDFHFQANDSGFYQGFTPGWSFPPG
ncbi:hypothetical protein N7499_002822 [Penicillium canescens]|nr:hypothetical protein N7499_002822 [Penicillium canescens]KAJ6166437.1 hypothetical protein N7485_009681 [Penicillium canescens]